MVLLGSCDTNSAEWATLPAPEMSGALNETEGFPDVEEPPCWGKEVVVFTDSTFLEASDAVNKVAAVSYSNSQVYIFRKANSGSRKSF